MMNSEWLVLIKGHLPAKARKKTSPYLRWKLGKTARAG
jgi:hypothetical protein